MPSETPCKIVLIDDLADYTQILKKVLELDGHTVFVANDSKAGLALMRQLRPDAAFIDIGLPELDGYALVKRLRAEGSRSFIVALTAYGGDRTKMRAIESGFDRHILKPLLPDERRDVTRLAVERASKANYN